MCRDQGRRPMSLLAELSSTEVKGSPFYFRAPGCLGSKMVYGYLLFVKFPTP